jgi:predicted transcriptional regulator
MKRRALLSIHPKHAEAILLGSKTYEFRKVLFKEKVNEIVIYATSPVCKVIGKFKIEEIYSASPSEVWAKAKDVSGVTEELFSAYFAGRQIAHAIKVSQPVRFVRPKPLSQYVKSNIPPQSYCYL